MDWAYSTPSPADPAALKSAEPDFDPIPLPSKPSQEEKNRAAAIAAEREAQAKLALEAAANAMLSGDISKAYVQVTGIAQPGAPRTLNIEIAEVVGG